MIMCVFVAVAKIIKAPRMTFHSHTKTVLAVTVLHIPTISPLVISGGEDKQLVVSSLATGSEVVALEGHVQKITGVSTAQHGDRIYLISCSWDENIRCWPVECFLNLASSNSSSSGGGGGGGGEGERGRVTAEEKEEIKRKCLVLRGHRNRVYDLAVLRVRSVTAAMCCIGVL